MSEVHLIEFNGWGVFKKYFLEKTFFTWFIINAFTTIILFAFITLGLLFEWPIRKVFTITSSKDPSQKQKKATLSQHKEPSRIHGITLKGSSKSLVLIGEGSLKMKIVIANSVGVDTNGYHMVHVPSRWSLGVKNHTNCSYYPMGISLHILAFKT